PPWCCHTVAGCERRTGFTVGPSPCATFRRSVADGSFCRKPFVSGSSSEQRVRQRSVMRLFRIIIATGFCWAAVLNSASAQERAYFVTYDHYLEETGNLEVAVASTTGFPK